MSNNINVNVKLSLPEINCEMINCDSKRLKKYAVVRWEEKKQYILVERETGNVILYFNGYVDDDIYLGGNECYVVDLVTSGLCLVSFNECGEIKISPEFKEIINDNYKNYIVVEGDTKGEYYCIDKNFNFTSAHDTCDLCIGEFRLIKEKSGRYTINQTFKDGEDKYRYIRCLVTSWVDNGGIIFVNKNKLKQYINVNTKICSKEYTEITFLNNPAYIVGMRQDRYEELVDTETGKVIIKAGNITNIYGEYIQLVTADEIKFMRLSDKAIWEMKPKTDQKSKNTGGIIL